MSESISLSDLKKNLAPIHGTCNYASQICRSRKKYQNLETESLVQEKRQSSQNRGEIIREDLSGLDYKHNPPNRAQPDIRQFLRAKSSADIAREEQDRKKRFKTS